MRTRWFLFLAVCGLVAMPTPARPAEDKVQAPTVIVRLRSIDGLISDFQYLATLAGKAEEAKQIDGFLQSWRSEKGLQGIDPKRPLGLYGTVNPGLMDSTAVVLVPIADEKTLLGFLENFAVKAKKGDDDIYTISRDNLPVPIYARFANQYAYITAQDKAALAKEKLLDPTQVLPADHTGTVSALIRLDQLPDTLKQIVLGQMELRLAEVQDDKKGESEAQHKVKVATMQQFGRNASLLLREGREITVRIDIDRQAQVLSTEFSVNGKPKSKLASHIAELGGNQSLFGALARPNSAASLLLHATLPAEFRQAFVTALEEEIRKGLENEKDKTKRAQATKLFNALEPTLKAGELDLGFDLRGPDANKLYSPVIGLKIQDGTAVEKTLRSIIKDLPEAGRAKIQLDAESAGAVKIHRLDAGKDFEADARRILGENPLYVAFRNDAVLLAGGPNGLSVLKEALIAQPKSVPPAQFAVSLARLAPAIEGKHKEAVKAAQETFAKNKEADKIWITVEGGEALKARFYMDAAVLKFIVSLHEKAEK